MVARVMFSTSVEWNDQTTRGDTFDRDKAKIILAEGYSSVVQHPTTHLALSELCVYVTTIFEMSASSSLLLVLMLLFTVIVFFYIRGH